MSAPTAVAPPAATPAVAPSAAPPPAGSPPPSGRRRLLLGLLLLAVLIVGGAWLAYYLLHGRFFEYTDDAYANGNVVQITPQIPGTIVAISVDDNDRVTAGQTLVQFDGADAEVGLASADAALARAVRQVRGLYSQVSSLDAEVTSRQVTFARARADLARRQDLMASGAIPAEELAHAREALAAAEAALNAARQQAATARAMVDDTAVASHPEVLAAAASVRKSYLDHLRVGLKAPVGGYVAQRRAQVGQRVQAGTPLMAVVPLEQMWVDANFKETQLGAMRIGQPVSVRADLYGDKVVYRGRVESLGVGTGGAFSLLPPQNATGNWIKIVQRIPVRIALDPADLAAHPLRLGLSMHVEVDLHNQDGPVLVEQARAGPAMSTDIFHRQLAEADDRIHRIIAENLGAPGPSARHPVGAAPLSSDSTRNVGPGDRPRRGTAVGPAS